MDAHTALDLALRIFNQSIHQISQWKYKIY
jgi:hypothetical protein